MANGEKSGGDSSSEEEDPNGKAAINSIATTTGLRIKPKKTNTYAQMDVLIHKYIDAKFHVLIALLMGN